MTGLLRWRTRLRVEPWIADAALAAIFAGCALADALGSAGDDVLGDIAGIRDPGAPRWLSAALVLTASVAMAWRRRSPLWVVTVVAVSLSLDASLVSHTASFFGGYLLLIVISYTLAAYASGRDAVIGIAIAMAGFATTTLSIDQLQVWHDLLLNAGVLAAAIGFGRVVRRLRGHARSLTLHAERLERQSDEQAHAAVALERTRIARELHDVIAHSVSLMGVQAAAAEQVLPVDPDRAREPLRAIQETARDAIDELRRLLGVLRDAEHAATALVPQPDLDALGALVEQMRAAGLPVELRVEGRAEKLSPGVELSAYRVVQEALTNTLKHAGPVATTVVVQQRADAIELQIVNRGKEGADGAGTGHGLIGMRERVALYEGKLSARRTADGGYAVSATIPTDGRHQ